MVEQQEYLDPDLVGALRRRIGSIQPRMFVYALIMGILSFLVLLSLVLALLLDGLWRDLANDIFLVFFFLWGFQGLIVVFYGLRAVQCVLNYTRRRLGLTKPLEANDHRIILESGNLTERHGVQQSNVLAGYYIIVWTLLAILWPFVAQWMLNTLDNDGLVNEFVQFMKDAGLTRLAVTLLDLWTNTGLSEALNVIDVDQFIPIFVLGPSILGLFIAFRYGVWLLEKLARHENKSNKIIFVEIYGFGKIVQRTAYELTKGSLSDEFIRLLVTTLVGVVVTTPFFILLLLLLSI